MFYNRREDQNPNQNMPPESKSKVLADPKLLKEKRLKLRYQVDLLREAKRHNKLEEAQKVSHDFEYYIRDNFDEQEYYQKILEGLLGARNQLLQDYKKLVKKYPEHLGFSGADDWHGWAGSLKNTYEKHPHFQNWPTLMKASILFGQIERVKDRLSEAKKLEAADEKYKEH